MSPTHVTNDKADRIEVTYACPANHQFVMIFAAGITAPATWDCPRCGKLAQLDASDQVTVTDTTATDIAKSHWDMLLERRSMAELSDMLSERASNLRS
ncbi:MAG: RNA polymerase-binding protein RbpA [Propionibacteriaceae bacterium]|nr:RNA polymerase-binding protein RbpA [Propionibacteriaceae bacterium]